MKLAGTMPDECGFAVRIARCRVPVGRSSLKRPNDNASDRHLCWRQVADLKKERGVVPGSSSGNGVGRKLKANRAPVERLLYSRKDAATALSVSLRRIDYGLANGEFETRRVGRRVLITARSLKQWANTNHHGPVRKRSRADQNEKAA
jgi:hypothetical protein